MEEVVHYLEMKNQYYDKFLEISEKFLHQNEESKWEDLPFFVDNRERILNIIRSFDLRIAKAFEKAPPSQDQLVVYRARVRSLMNRRKEVADRILEIDLELMSQIDEVKSETIRELKKTQRTVQQVDSFTGLDGGPKSSKEKTA